MFLYDLKGNYIRSFKSIKDAAKYINGCDKTIMNCCLGKANSSYGYYWSYKKEFNYKNNHKKIAQYTLSGKFLRVFDSIIEAESELQLNSISQAIKKKYQCGGYQWRFYENKDNISPLMNIFSRTNNIPIIMIDNDKEIEYSSIKECAIKNNLSSSQINRVLKGIIKSHHGFKFRYKDEDIV